jgi:hypothetical protein
MWCRNGKAFVWIEHNDGQIELVGEREALIHQVTMDKGIAMVHMPSNLVLHIGDSLAGILSVEANEEELGEGPWIG